MSEQKGIVSASVTAFAQAGVPIPASLELGNIEATKEGVAAGDGW